MHDGKTKTHFLALPYENWILACTREMGLAAAKINLSKKKKPNFSCFIGLKRFSYIQEKYY